jgi:release factor glutamine methyltransferase
LRATTVSGEIAVSSVDEALTAGRQRLSASRTAALDAQLLLCHVLAVPRSWLFAHGEAHVLEEQQSAYRALVSRRAEGEPVAYLRGFVEWFGLDLLVSPSVLIPRPETEVLAERAIALALKQKARTVAEIGTGCGAISIAFASRLPKVEIIASDVDPDALEVAAKNLQRLGMSRRVRLVHGSLLYPFRQPPDLLVANLPYLSEEMMREVSREVLHEPRRALLAGEAGIELYEHLLEQMRDHGWRIPALLEIDPRQRTSLAGLVARVLPDASLTFEQDYASLDRIAVIEQ